MILEYHRPQTLQAALELLERPTPRTIPLGGGSVVTRLAGEPVAVVDLQLLGLDQIEQQGSAWALGAALHLQQLVEHPALPFAGRDTPGVRRNGEALPEALKEAICLDETLNSRNMATLAGAIVSNDGTSALLTVLLALDARLVWLPSTVRDTPLARRSGEALPDGVNISLGDYLPLRSTTRFGSLITQIQFPISARVHFAAVGRSPKDRPVVAAAVARWPSGRTRVVLGGDAPAPVLAMDGTEAGDIEILAQNACTTLSTHFASRDYLYETAKTLIQRLLQK